MRRLMTGSCKPEDIFSQVDPTSYLEIEFEAEVVKALACLFPQYKCGVFAGMFNFEGDRRRADLALLHESFNHWFVVEVELAGHSFEHHVLPQVRCFRYGEPETSCETSLMRTFSGLSRESAQALLHHVPRQVAVIANMESSEWRRSLSLLEIQLLTLSVFRNANDARAFEVNGQLSALRENLGFAHYSEINRALRIRADCGIKSGIVEICDQFGISNDWMVREQSGTLWISKVRGPTLLQHESWVQIIRLFDGRLMLRPSRSSAMRS